MKLRGWIRTDSKSFQKVSSVDGCVKTLLKFEDWKMTMTTTHSGKIIERTPGVTCSTDMNAVVMTLRKKQAVKHRRLASQKKNTDTAQRNHYRWGSQSGPREPDVHGPADDADFSRTIPIQSAPHGDRLDLALVGRRPSHFGSFPTNPKKTCHTAARRACVRNSHFSRSAHGVTDFTEICTTTVVDVFVVGYVWFRNRFGGRLQWAPWKDSA